MFKISIIFFLLIVIFGCSENPVQTEIIYRTDFSTPKSITVTSENLNLPTTEGNFFSLSSSKSETVRRIDSSDWTIGSIIYLYFDDSVSIVWNTKESIKEKYLPIAKFADENIASSGTFNGKSVAILIRHTSYWILLNL